MRKNRVILIVTIVLIVVSATLLLTRTSGTYKNKDKNFAVQDTAAVNKIFLANKGDTHILLERMGPGTWKLNGEYEAAPHMVNIFMETIHGIKPERPLAKSASENIIKRLSVVATKVEIYGTAYRINFLGLKLFPHEKMIKCYYIGDATQDNLGTYMLMDGSDIPFVVTLPGFRGYVASRYQILPNDWRSHSVFDIGANEIKAVAVEHIANPEQSFALNTSTPNGKLSFTNLQGEPAPFAIDTLKIYNYLNSFKRINFEAFMKDDFTAQQKDSVINSTPNHILTLELKNGTTHQVKTFPIVHWDIIDLETNQEAVDEDRAYALLDNDELVVIQYFTFDKILRNRSYFYLPPPQRK